MFITLLQHSDFSLEIWRIASWMATRAGVVAVAVITTVERVLLGLVLFFTWHDTVAR